MSLSDERKLVNAIEILKLIRVQAKRALDPRMGEYRGPGPYGALEDIVASIDMAFEMMLDVEDKDAD